MSFFGLSPSLALDARGCFDEDALEDALEALGLFFVEDFDAGIGEKEGRSGDCKPLNPNPQPHFCQLVTTWPRHQQNLV